MDKRDPAMQDLVNHYANAHVYAAIVAILEGSILRGSDTHGPAERILGICRKEIIRHFRGVEAAEKLVAAPPARPGGAG